MIGALVQDDGYARERNDVVDDGRFPEQSLDRRKRRLRSDDSALALQAFQHRRFLAADVGPRSEAHFHAERAAASLNVVAQVTAAFRGLDRRKQRALGMRVFGAKVDIA